MCHLFRPPHSPRYDLPCRAKENVLVRGSSALIVTNQRFYGGGLLAPAQPPSWRTTPYRLSATAYSIYSHLPYISGGRLLRPQPEDAPCRGDRGPLYMDTDNVRYFKLHSNTDWSLT
jgi:hypothetical protein